MEKKGNKVKQYNDENVYVASKKRVEYCFKNYDKVVVSFSGGKDSTAVLNVALEVAKEQNKLPIDVVYFDEECVHPPTIEYVRRVSQLESVNFHWLCMEWKHRNACSNESPYWYCWDSDNKDLWTRELPPEAITEHPRWKKGLSFQEFAPYYYDKEVGSVCMLTGVRTQESLRRLQVITSKQNDSYLQSSATWNCVNAHVIYDWESEDVWLATHKFNWDYNKTYDIFNQTRIHGRFLTQRVCPPFGEEPIRGLWLWSQCFPEFWDKMVNRVPGVKTAWRYSNTELYSSPKEKPEHLTFQEYLPIIIDTYVEPYKNKVKQTLNKYIKAHYSKTSMELEEDSAHPVSGCSWKFLCRAAIRGDFKGRQANYLLDQAIKKCETLGIDLEEAKRRYGKQRN